MFMSRQLEETRKTKFRRGKAEEEVSKSKSKKKDKPRSPKPEREGFNMWEDQPDEGC